VARHEQRHQLVTQFLVGHRAAVVVTRLEEHREHVVPIGEVVGLAALADLRVDQLVGGLEPPAHPVQLSDAPRPERREDRHPQRLGGEPEAALERVGEPLDASRVADAKDRADDHLERDRLHRRPRGERPPGGPPLDLPGGDFRHRLLVAAHALAMERRQHQLALRHVRVVVEQQHGVAAQHRQQHDVRLARVEEPRVAGEDLLHRVRVAEEHPRSLVGDLEREHVAVAPLRIVHERGGTGDPARRLEGAGSARPRRGLTPNGV